MPGIAWFPGRRSEGGSEIHTWGIGRRGGGGRLQNHGENNAFRRKICIDVCNGRLFHPLGCRHVLTQRHCVCHRPRAGAAGSRCADAGGILNRCADADAGGSGSSNRSGVLLSQSCGQHGVQLQQHERTHGLDIGGGVAVTQRQLSRTMANRRRGIRVVPSGNQCRERWDAC